jgi:glycopeptide antibiotics resistance protein
MERIDIYLNDLLRKMNLDEAERLELLDELRDHLTLSTKAYMEKGCDVNDAAKNAIRDFGKSGVISKELQSSMHPLGVALRILFWIALIIYSLYLCKVNFIGTLITLPNGVLTTSKAFYHFRGLDLIPMNKTLNYIVNRDHYNFNIWFENTFGNVLLFIPLGFLLPALFRKFQGWKAVIIVAMVITIIIEVAKYLSGIGVASTDNVMLRTLGAMLGWVIFLFGRHAAAFTQKKLNATTH